MASPTLSQSSLGNLDDLDLESGSARPHSRPIGESSKYRSTSHVMHISHADITEMEALMRHDEETSLLSFMAAGVELSPGANRFTLKGKVRVWPYGFGADKGQGGVWPCGCGTSGGQGRDVVLVMEQVKGKVRV